MQSATNKQQLMISGILLAAGESRRMGRPKLLLPWKEGMVIEHVVDTYLSSDISELIVVSGAEAERIESVLAGRRVVMTTNWQYEQGMGTSIRRGIEAASTRADAYLIALADQPLITVEIINRLIRRYGGSKPLIAAASHQGRRGHPIIFSKALRNELCEVRGDEGGRSVINKYSGKTDYVEVGSSAIFADMDTVEEYEKINPA
jgi:molybdenum cofactor cytidylyltransferase